MSRTKTSPFRLLVVSVLAIPLGFIVMSSLGQSPMPLVDDAVNKLPIELVSWTGLRTAEPAVIGTWPPSEGDIYPDLVLSDQSGETVRLSDFAGKVILLELAAVPCKGCQAFAGGNNVGGFAGVAAQRGLDSIHDYAERFAGVKLGQDKDVVLVQLLLYGKGMSSPTQQEVSGWAQHFGMERANNELVLRGDPSMLGSASYQMIPGFHLIDRDFVLRLDSSGHRPKCDLYRDLLPELGKMCR